MFARRVPLARLLGFEIRFDLTWLILVALVIWMLSAGYFPATDADLPTSTYVWMGVLGAIGLFVSIVLHELSHSVVGRWLGMEIHGITLFAFGGAAEMTEEPPTARAEFLMAIAGPLMSVVLAGAFYLLGLALAALAVPGPIVTVIGYLTVANLILAAFNLVPAFPLDGGRVLRAALWGWRGDVAWATRLAAMIGGGLGLGLVFLGIVSALYGNLIGGMWWFLIGLFIRAAATASYQRLLARHMLEGVPVRRIMKAEPIGAPPTLPVSELVEDYLLGHSLKRVPVVDNGRFLGVVGVEEVKAVPPEERARRSIGDVLARPPEGATIAPDAEAIDALSQMQRAGRARLFVVEGGRLAGILALADLLQYLSVKSELQPASEEPPRGRPGRRPEARLPADR